MRRVVIWAALLLGFQVLCALVYRDALRGPFLSDDVMVIEANPYAAGSLRAALATFLPGSDARDYVGGNYAPLVHVAHGLQHRFMGERVVPYHRTNVAVHALNATLLAAVFHAMGIPLVAAATAGALFALHPANVEAVAWASQLRTLLAMTCTLAALLLFRRGSRLSTLPFAAGLLFKASAAAALPAAAVLYWSSRRRDGEASQLGPVLTLWTLVFLVYAPIQLDLFAAVAPHPGNPYPDAFSHLASSVAIAARYLAMAVTGYGTAAYQVPAPVTSPLDPWWLGGLLVVGASSVWTWVLLRRGERQAAFWVFAAASFVPVSQVIPFNYPIADRYLYFILPGIFGGIALAGVPLWRGLEARLEPGPGRHILRGAALAFALAGCLAFGLESSSRAGLWTSWEALYRDSARRYPDGFPAHYLRAVESVREGELEVALSHLERYVAADGHILSYPLELSPHFYALEDDPRYQELLRRAARRVVAVYGESGHADDVVRVARALLRLEDFDEAEARIEAALEGAGEDRDELFTMLMTVRGARSAHERERSAPHSMPVP